MGQPASFRVVPFGSTAGLPNFLFHMRHLPASGYFAKRLLGFAGLVALPLLLAVAVLLQESYSKAHAHAASSLSLQAAQIAHTVREEINRAEAWMAYLHTRPELDNPRNPNCETLFHDLPRLDSAYWSTWVADESGAVVCGSPAGIRTASIFTALPAFREALANPSYVLSPPVGQLAALMLHVDTPETAPQRVIGVTFNLAAFSARMREIASGPKNILTLVSATSGVIYARSHEASKFVGAQAPQRLILPLTKDILPTSVIAGPDGVPRLYAGAPVGSYQLHVASGLPDAEVFAASRILAAEALGALLAVLLLTLGLACVGAHRLAEPLTKLVDTVRKQRAGTQSARAPGNLPGEFAVLSKEFNAMLDAKERSEQMLRESEKKAQRMSNFYSALSEANQALGKLNNISALFDLLCTVCVESGNAKVAWIGYVKEGRLAPAAWHGPIPTALHDVHVPIPASSPDKEGPAAAAVRTGEPVVVSGLAELNKDLLWVRYCLKVGIRSIAAVPFFKGGQVAGVLNLYVEEAEFFDAALLQLLQELTLVLSFALENENKP